jgi:hypothetical protein
VAIADFSKNVYATYAACGSAALEVVALIDPRDAFAEMHYRGLPILKPSALRSLAPDGVVVSNTNPSQVAARAEQVKQAFPGPVLTLWAPRYLESPKTPDANAA